MSRYIVPSKYSPELIDRIVARHSVLFPNDIHLVLFIHCKKAYALAEMAKQYTWNTHLYGKQVVDLAKSILLNDPTVIDQLPKPFLEDVREWIWFFQQMVIPERFRAHTVGGPSIEFRIIDAEVYHESAYKRFVPFTNLYNLHKYETSIETMMKEITETVYAKPLYVSILLPPAKTDIPTDEDNIAIDVLRPYAKDA